MSVRFVNRWEVNWAMIALLLYLAIINLVAYMIMGVDKSRSKSGAWRVSEKHLLLIALAGGAAGMLLGMRVFKHKTRHTGFIMLIPVMLLLQSLLMIWAYRQAYPGL